MLPVTTEFSYQLAGNMDGSGTQRTTTQTTTTNYVMGAAKAWDFKATTTHANSGSYYNICDTANNALGNTSLFLYSYGSYTHSGTTKNDGTADTTGVSQSLTQPSGDAVINFHDLVIIATRQDSNYSWSRYKYELNIVDAQGSGSRFVSGTMTPTSSGIIEYLNILTDSGVTLGTGEYIENITVTPVNSGGTEGSLMPKNGFGMRYQCKAWNGQVWPSGNPVNPESTAVTMVGTLRYNNESGVSQERKNSCTIYYVKSPVMPAAQFVNADNTGQSKNPGDTVSYVLNLYNYIYGATAAWNDPIIAFRAPKYLQLTSVSEGSYTGYYDSAEGYYYYILRLNGSLARSDQIRKTVDLTFKIADDAKQGGYTFDCVWVSSGAGYSYIYNISAVSGITGTGYGYVPSGIYSGFANELNALSYNFIYQRPVSLLTRFNHTGYSINKYVRMAGVSEVKTNSTGGWIAEAVVPAAQNENANVRLTLTNSGNMAMSDIRLYDIIPYDGYLGSDGAAKFTGVSDASGWTVYYYTGVNAPDLDDAASISLSQTGWNAAVPVDMTTVKAVMLVYGGTLNAGESLSATLNFNVDEDDVTVYNRYSFCYTADGSTTTMTSGLHGFSTKVYMLSYNANTTDTTVAGIPTAVTGDYNNDKDGSGNVYVTVSASIPTRDGYIFSGWNTQIDGTGMDYAANSTVTFTATSTSLTLYAKWTPLPEYTVTYHTSGGSGSAPLIQRATWDNSYNLFLAGAGGLSKIDYTFKEWNTNASANATNTGGTAYTAGDQYTIGTNLDLYAIWGAALAYNANNGTGAPSDSTVYYVGESVMISTVQPTRTNYTFMGWSSSQNAATAEYAAGGNITLSQNTTLYVVWTADTYTISYENLQSVTNSSNPTIYTYGIGVASFADPGTRTGYTFDGWYNAAAGGSKVTDISTTATGAVTLYARWTPNTYQISMKYETRTGGSVTGKTDFTASADHDSTYTPTASQVIAPTGYVLVGWKLNGTLQSGTSPSINPVSEAAAITLVYGLDRGATGDNPSTGIPDGIEDIIVTKQWYDTVGNIYMLPAAQKVINVGDSFRDLYVYIIGYDYKGYRIDDGALQSGSPNKAASGGDADYTITYVYERLDYQVQINYELRDGSNLSGVSGFTRSVYYGTNYAPLTSEMQVSDYVLVGWKLNGTLQSGTSPSISFVLSAAAITLIYSRDSNGDGIEDYDVMRKWEMTDGSSITGLPSQTVAVNVGDTFTMAHDSGITILAGLTYEGYYLSSDGGTILHTGTPNYTVNITDGDVTVTYIYSTTQYTVTVYHVNRAGDPVGSPTSADVQVGHGTRYSPVPQTINGYVFAAWKVGAAGALQNNTGPSVTIAGTTDIYLVYGYDRDSNGKEDIRVTKQFLGRDGTELKPSQMVIVNVGDTLSDIHDMITGYDYQGYLIDGGELQNGEPELFVGSITGLALFSATTTVTGDTTVSYVFSPTQYTITVKVVDENGGSIGDGSYDWRVSKSYQESFTAAAPTIQGYTYQYWKLDGTQKSGSIEISSVEAAATITLVYQKSSTLADPEDQGNYKFVKGTDVKKVKAGETINYTFINFGNNWAAPLEEYAIYDTPDKGLDFKSADLPAFTNGSGVTYDVVYYTNQKGRTALYSDIPAGQVFSFKAPDLASGEYITAIALEFGTVPAGFAVGDSITMTFRVWDNPPSQTLVNVGMLSYKINGENKEFVTGGGSSAITIEGYFGTPKTGDNSDLRSMFLMLLGSLGGMTALSVIIRRRRRKRA